MNTTRQTAATSAAITLILCLAAHVSWGDGALQTAQSDANRAISPSETDRPLLTSRIPVPPETSSPQGIPVAHCSTPPRIDGVIDDPCWRTATHGVGFYRYQGTSPIAEQTETWLCADTRHLYIAFHCLDNHPEQILAAETLRNGNLSNDDYVGVQVDSQNTRHSTSTFLVSARGTQAETLEGGTADNITWAGDWTAAVKRVPDGWTVEIAIPWALMRYPHDTHTVGIFLTRKLARETSQECWPYMSRDQQSNTIQYLTSFTGVAPADYKPRPTFLPYVLGTAGEGYAARYGLDVKYPVSTTMTGLATINPDFRDVVQSVQSINFSYDQRMYSDSRPFFQEGSDFMPYSDVFYSLDIGQIDEGAKFVGKEGGTKIAALATNSSENGGRSDEVVSLYQDVGPLSDVHFSAAQDNQAGVPSSLAAKVESTYIWQAGQTHYEIIGNHEPTWAEGRPADSRDYLSFQTTTPHGKPFVYVDYTDVGPRFTNNIGFLPEFNARGFDWNAGQNNVFDTGKLWDYGVYASGDQYDYHTGGFFHNSVSLQTWVDYQSGWGLAFNTLERHRVDFRDHVNEAAYYWNERSLYAGGYIDNQWGTEADQHYDYLSVSQGYALSRTVTSSVNYYRQNLGGQITTQTVFSGTYRLTYERSIGMRAVQVNNDINLFLSFAQKARRGSDIYLLVGNPNSSRTQGLVTVKVVTPF